MRFDGLVYSVAGPAVLAAAAVISGCVNSPERPAYEDNIQSSPAATITHERDPILDLLDYAGQLHEARPEAREEAVANARTRASSTPSAMSYARLAVAFGTPGQRRYTPDEAARYAQRALDADDAQWSPAARQYLADYARLYATITSQVQPAATTAPTVARRDPPVPPATPTVKNNTQEQQRVRALEKQLDEAHRKLRELADIEDRLSETGS